MKVVICGPRTFEDFDVIEKAVEKSGFDVDEVVSGHAKGADALGEMWARKHDKKIKLFPAMWNDLKQEGAVVKTNKWKKKYNANAGFFRNEEMAKYADACVAIFDDTGGTKNMIKNAKENNLKLFVYNLEENIDDDELGYSF